MYPQEADFFWLSLLTIATILLSFLLVRKLLKNKRSIQPIPTENSVLNTPSTPDSSTAAAAAAGGGEYEVFLSFRGEDTRKGFTDFLYTNLVDAGIRTFRDDEELRIGKELGPDLLKAINESKISIPVFSKNYASSEWCLLELEEMVECHKTKGQMILPVFYDVKPSDVREQKGCYKKAFRQHQKNFDEKTIQGWKDAMKLVGTLKGLELDKATNGHEGKLAKMVVEEVVLGLKKNYTQLPDNLVGMDHHVNEMERLLDVNYDGVRIVGIHGMGGIGKTTISKFIYNRLCDRFESCCFLDDVRERSHDRNDVVSLQNELVSKVIKQQFIGINNADEGIRKIKDVVHGKKVLLVLDDIDGISQFNKLVGKCNWFSAGSRIVVTTRNKDALDTIEVTCQREGLLEVYKSYEPQLMSDDHSLQLFSKYAFKQDLPPESYNQLSRDFVSTAAGLPLVIVTIGSLLFGKEEKALWEETLRKLRRIPRKEVMDKLRISFEALDYEEQQIFLDIACLFIGEDQANPLYMWDDCGFYPRTGIHTLVHRSLVRVGDDNKLRMHDQLRDLGREIVREENLKEPTKRSRVFHHEGALDVLKEGLGPHNVEALCFDFVKRDRSYGVYKLFMDMYRRPRLAGEDFAKLPKLRYLSVAAAELVGDFKGVHSRLRWLKWRGCSEDSEPTNLFLGNLVILQLKRCGIRDSWKLWSEIKMARKLKVLNLEYCSRLKSVPHLSAFASLESLELDRCTSLCSLDGLEQLVSLSCFRISQSDYLETLPDLSKLGKLRTLKFHKCGSLTAIQGLDKLVSLELLDTSDCPSLERLPNLSNLQKLTSFNAHGCSGLTEIPGLDRLRSLEQLNMNECRSLKRIPDLSNLKRLRTLEMTDLKVTEVQGLGELESLEHLAVRQNKCLERLPDLSKLRRLKKTGD